MFVFCKKHLSFAHMILAILFLLKSSESESPSVPEHSIPATQFSDISPENLIIRTLKGGDQHSYRLRLEKGEFAHIIVDQLGVDLVATVQGPNDNWIVKMDSPNGSYGPEYICVLAESAGFYRIDIAALDKEAGPGTYLLQIDAKRAAVVADRDRVLAQQLFSESSALMASETEDHLHEALIRYGKSAALYHQAHDLGGEAASWQAISMVYSALRNRDKTLDSLQKAVTAFGQLNRPSISAGLLKAQLYLSLGQQKQSPQDFNKAALVFRNSLTQVNRLHLRREAIADISFYLGETFFYLGKLNDARRILLKALKIQKAESDGQSLDVAATCNDLGKIYEARGPAALGKAESFFKCAFDIRKAKLNSRDERVLSSTVALTQIYVSENKFEEAAGMLQDRLSHLHRDNSADDDRPFAVTAASLANVYLEEGRYGKAEQLLQTAQKICRIKQCPEFPDVLDILGQLYLTEGRFPEADRAMRSILNLYPKGTASEAVARQLHNLALLSESQKNYPEAEALLGQSQAMIQAIRKPHKAEMSGNLAELGKVKLELKKYAEAEALLKQAIKGFSVSLGDSTRLAAALQAEAALFRIRHHYKRAAEIYKRAIRMIQKTNPSSPYIGRVLNNFGELSRETGDYKSAEARLKQAIAIDETAFGKEYYALISPLWNLAAVYQAQNHFSEAKSLLDRGSHILVTQFAEQFTYMTEAERLAFLNSASSLFNFYLSFCAARCQNDPELRRQTYDLLLWQKGLVAASIAALRTQILSTGDKDTLALFHRFYDEKSEMAGVRYMQANHVLGSRITIDDFQEKARADERELIRRVPLLEEQKRLAHPSWKEVQGRLKDGEAAIEVAKFVLFDGKKWTNDDHYLAFVISSKVTVAPDVVLLGSSKVVEATTLRDYCDQLLAPETLPLCNQSAGSTSASEFRNNTFYDVIWMKLQPFLRDVHRIYISPAGLLNQIALGIFPVPDNGRLIDKYDLRMLNSTKDLLRNENRFGGNSAVLIGNARFLLTENEHLKAVADVRHGPVRAGELIGHPISSGWIPRGLNWNKDCPNLPPGGQLCPLEASEDEVNSIYNLLISHHWTPEPPYTQQRALEEVVKSVQHPRLLHIATHGFFSPNEASLNHGSSSDPEPSAVEPMILSGLYFAGADRILNREPPLRNLDDGVLTALEASGLDLVGTELVVLSACDTGLGGTGASEGVFGLRRALQESGAGSVMLTMWHVNDSDAQKLLTEFYRNWLSGMDKHEALKKAQQLLRTEVKARFGGEDRPYYWGAFVLVGP